jgi:quinol monooxygenase YgiN
MLKVVSKAGVKEDKVDEYKRLVAELAVDSRKESGCISYQLLQDTEDQKILTFVEEWKDKDAFDFHTNTEHFKRIIPTLRQYREKSEVNFYNVVV